VRVFTLARNPKPITTQFRVAGFSCALLFVLRCSSLVAAQEIPDDFAPPPSKIISKEERKQLEAERDIKKHLLLSVGFLERHTARAEILTSDNSFDEALAELGTFEAILNEALHTLSKGNRDSGKVQNSGKMIEAALRRFSARIELMRRKMPSAYAYHVQKLIKVIRDARTKAIEPLWGEVVLPKTRISLLF
jgi:uncharacterized protein YicC (UPF0701 family)